MHMTKLFKFIISITVLLCSVSCYSKDEIETKKVNKPVLGNAAESITISFYNDLVVDYSLDALELFDILVNYQDGVPVSNKYLIKTENNEVLVNMLLAVILKLITMSRKQSIKKIIKSLYV